MINYPSGEFRASKIWPYAIAAGCVIYRKQRGNVEILLLEREAGHPNDPSQKTATHNLPKGHVGFEESLLCAAKRESEEETGATIEIQTYLGATINEFIHPRYGMFNSKTTHYFAAIWKKDNSRMDQEHDRRIWATTSEAIALLSKPSVVRGEAQFINNLLSFLEHTDES